MNFIKECFEENSGAFTEKLEGVGFSIEQAQNFLPETATSILASGQNIDIAQAIRDLLSETPGQLLNSIDVDSISEKLDIHSNQVRSGLGAIAPVLSKVILQKDKGIVDAISSLAWGSD